MNVQGNKIAVIYKSKYGTTKRYAEWIAEKLNAEIFSNSEFDASTLNDYSTVLFGSSVHIGKVKGIDFIKSNWQVLRNKKVVVFASTGSPKIEPKQQEVIKASLPAEISQCINYFPLPGAYNYSKLDFTDKLLMDLGPRMTLQLRAWFKGSQKAKEQLAVFCKEQDWTSKEAILPIVNCVTAA